MKNLPAPVQRRLVRRTQDFVALRAKMMRKYGMSPTEAFFTFKFENGQAFPDAVVYPLKRRWDSDERTTQFVDYQTLAVILRGFYTSMLQKMQTVC